MNLRVLGAVYYKAESGGHVGGGPSERLFATGCDGDAADYAVVVPVPELPQDHLPSGADKQRLQLQTVGDPPHQIDLEAYLSAPRNVLKGRVYEIGADAQDAGHKGWQSPGFSVGAAACRHNQQCSEY